ncbi:tetratricopeptide repeat protein, partial [Streptomyces resistomycificus]
VIARNINWALPAHLRNALTSPMADDRLAALDGLARLHRIGNDVVRSTVLDELRHLTDDDSRRVSTAAATRLRSLAPQTDASETPAEVPSDPSSVQPQASADPGAVPQDALGRRGEAHLEAGHFDQAIAGFTVALDLNPEDLWALAQRGETHRQAGRFDQAITDLTAALDLDPTLAWAHAERGAAHRQAGHFA